jgi:hypothetical protein
MKKYILFLIPFFLVVNCSTKSETNERIEKLFEFPKKVKEVSGITWHKNLVWSIQDSGNSNEVFGFDVSGKMEEKVEVKGASNIDWEDITTDKMGNLYIGDFGNNDNERQDLTIYKLDASDYSKVAAKITFYYPEQKDFPAKKKDKLYDCEAFFVYQNHLYLFTKNRSKGFDGTTLIYKIPTVAGHHKAQLVGKITTCSNYNSCVITGAAISPDEKRFVLLSHDRIWLFDNFKDDNFSSGTMTELELDHFSQKEGICFKNNETLLIADEKNKKTGGNLYEVSLKKLKSKS